MKVTQIPFKKTGFFSKTIIDYLEQKESITSFYNNFPDLNGFKNEIEEIRSSFSLHTRKVLVETLQNQYKNVAISDETQLNITNLLKSNTFTVTTGHQLNLFTGPLYFIYKIITTINLAEELKTHFPSENFVPIYWMATEDHDFDEINFFNFKNQKIQWNREDGGAVGHFSTEGLEEVFEIFSAVLGNSNNANYLKELFYNGYVKHATLTEATRYIANQLFAKYGLVIIDGDDKQLKELFTPYLKRELVEHFSFKTVSKTIEKLEKNYKIQVNPREINLFYLSENSRERIVFKDGFYKVIGKEITWSQEEILKEVEIHPENFSPNVILRPLYQEVLLPNLAYVGGGGELTYWIQLKELFTAASVPFPILLLRNSVQIISQKQEKKLDKLVISDEELFLSLHNLLALKVKENSSIQIDFSEQREKLRQQFKALKDVAKQTDVSFIGAVNAQEKKQLNGLDKLEKRLLRAEKRKQQELVDRISLIKNELFPDGGLEERQRNFSEYYLEYGDEFIKSLKSSLKPLALEFSIVKM